MQGQSFCYDFWKKDWVVCRNPKFSAENPEQVPAHFITQRQKDPSSSLKYMVWCQKHGTYEETATYEEHVLTTTAGCHLTGLFGEAISWIGDGVPGIQDVILRWRLLYCETSGIVTIFKDMARVVFQSRIDRKRDTMAYIPHLRHYRVESLSMKLSERKLTPKDHLREIPLIVANAALEFLRQEAERIYGQRPRLPQSLAGDNFTDGRTRLSAFMQYPFNMNLWLLNRYFDCEGDCMDTFSKSCNDAFVQLCHIFHLEPSKYLRNIYDAEPLAVPIIAVLNLLGVRRRELAEPFTHLKIFLGSSVADGLKEFTCGSVLSRCVSNNGFPATFFKDEGKIRSYLEARAGYHDTWNALLFYCHYLCWREDEESLARHLLEMNAKWEPRCQKSLCLFFHYYPDLPASIRDSVLKEGFPVSVHNDMVRIINQKKLDWPEFTYSEEERSYECEIDGYAFRLVYNSETYHSLMKEMGVHQPNYVTLSDNGALRMAIYKNGQAAAYFELHAIAKLKLNSSGFRYEHCLHSASIRMVFLRWLKWTGLWKEYGPYFEEDYEILRENVAVNPLPKGVGLSLYELLHLAETPGGYYLRLYHAFQMAKPLCFEVAVPNVYNEETEMAYLMELFPYGKRLYEAAFAGNGEARYVLSLCYNDGGEYHTLFPPNKERAKYW